MEASAVIKQEDGVEIAKICRRCRSAGDALVALTRDESGQFTGLQIEFSPGIPSYLCTMCGSRLEKQNTAKNGADISKDQLGHSAEQTVGTELLIKTEVTAPDAATDLNLLQRSCTAPQVNETHECCGNQPFEAEENPITIELEYVDVDELYRLQTNATLDHELDDLQTNPLELVCQDRENHSMSNNMCADGTELLIKTEVNSPDATLDLHLNQKNCTAHEANWTYECFGHIPDDLFEAEGNPIAIKSEDEEIDDQQQLQTTTAVLDHEQDNQKINPLESIYHDHPWQTVADNTCADDSAVESIQNDLSLGTQNAHSKSHSQNHKHHCPRCSTTYPSLSMLKEHIRTHTSERPFQCKVCDKLFHSSRNLAKHSKIHNKDQPHQCPHCSSRFVQSTSLKNHIRTHTGERPYQCKVCDKAFHSSSILAEHSKIHNKDQHHQCPHCSAMFAHFSKLKIHIRTHTGERPYQCKICDKAFYSLGILTQHSKIHNKDKPHQCPHCSSKFSRLLALRIHIRTHTGERPYQCKVCHKAFRSSSILAEHSKIHNKDKQLKCPHCSSMFARSSDLKVHIRTHTGEKPYQCKFCDKAFRSASNRMYHYKKHHKGETC